MNKQSSQVKRKNSFNTGTSLKSISCLVTGFDPFNDAYENPSASIAKAMPNYLNLKKSDLKVSIKSIILPTIGDKAWSMLKSQIDALPPKKNSIIVMIGQAAKRKVIGIERFALNFRDYKIKDNTGKMFIAQRINVRAPEALRTDAPIEVVLKYLLATGLPVEDSNHAGTFICNETYFRALHYINYLKLPCMVYFVHVPLPRIYSKALADAKLARWSKLATGKENQLKAMTEAIKLLVKFSAEYIIEK
jgi:pyroglutamyl-peptidase